MKVNLPPWTPVVNSRNSKIDGLEPRGKGVGPAAVLVGHEPLQHFEGADSQRRQRLALRLRLRGSRRFGL